MELFIEWFKKVMLVSVIAYFGYLYVAKRSSLGEDYGCRCKLSS